MVGNNADGVHGTKEAVIGMVISRLSTGSLGGGIDNADVTLDASAAGTALGTTRATAVATGVFSVLTLQLPLQTPDSVAATAAPG